MRRRERGEAGSEGGAVFVKPAIGVRPALAGSASAAARDFKARRSRHWMAGTHQGRAVITARQQQQRGLRQQRRGGGRRQRKAAHSGPQLARAIEGARRIGEEAPQPGGWFPVQQDGGADLWVHGGAGTRGSGPDQAAVLRKVQQGSQVRTGADRTLGATSSLPHATSSRPSPQGSAREAARGWRCGPQGSSTPCGAAGGGGRMLR